MRLDAGYGLLVAANGVIVPMLCEYYALEGISDLVATVRKICRAIKHALAYDAHAKGTQAYLDLADELIARLEK